LDVLGALDQRVGARPGALFARGEAGVEQLRLVLDLLRRPAGIGIAAHDAHEHGVVWARPDARNLERNLLAGADRYAVGIARQRCSHFFLPLVGRYSRPNDDDTPRTLRQDPDRPRPDRTAAARPHPDA